MLPDKFSILKKYWNYDSFRGNQGEIVDSVLAGKDTLAMLPTGGGKSVCFQVPAMCMEGLCIVISPLIALMKDQVQNLNSRGISANLIYSGFTRRETMVELNNCMNGKYKFLYISPERLSNKEFEGYLRSMPVCLIAVDEAHCISQWGYDFRPEYLKIGQIRESFKVPVIALTASATSIVAKDIQEKLNFKNPGVFRQSFFRKNLSYLVLTEADKNTRILRILTRVKGSGLIYVRNRKKTEELSRFLSKSGFKVDFYHAGLSNEIRSRKLLQWKENEISVMVCTNAFGMGIDKPDVRLVIHYEIPDSLESYYQEAGRAGRDGLDSYCVLLWQPSDGAEASDRQLQQFPSLAQVEQVYQSLGNYFNLGINAGTGTDHAFDIGDFCDKFRLRPSIVISVLKLLHKHDLIAMNQAVEKPSKIKIICSHTELYDFQIRNPNLDPFIKLILRTCGGGVFADYTSVEEALLAKRAGISAKEVLTLLKRLQQLNILDFVPRNEAPLITFLCDRMSKTGITRVQLEENKERAMDRLHSLIRFCEDEAECRSKILLRYFDEENTQMCGNCDVCRKLNREKISEEDWKLGILKLTKLLEMGAQSMEEIISASGVKSEKLMSTIVRMLMDEEKLTLDENHKITWHERR